MESGGPPIPPPLPPLTLQHPINLQNESAYPFGPLPPYVQVPPSFPQQVIPVVPVVAPPVAAVKPEPKVDDAAEKAKKEAIANMPIRTYLDQTVVPILLDGMSELVKLRPDDPIQWLADYIAENNPNKERPAKRAKPSD